METTAEIKTKQSNGDKDYGLVSVIMPSYNAAEFLRAAIESVIAQTYTNWELIVADDCSTDDSVEIIKAYQAQHANIRLLQNEKNYGAAHTRNVALRAAKGDWIAFLDSDDYWSKEKLEKQLAFMVENGSVFSYTQYNRTDEKDAMRPEILTGPDVVTESLMFRYCYVGCLTVMYKMDAIGLIQIDERIGNGRNDYALWLKVCKKADCYLLRECLATYRLRLHSLSHTSFFTLLRYQYELFRYGEEKTVVGALLFTARNLFYGALKKIFYKRKDKTKGE